MAVEVELVEGKVSELVVPALAQRLGRVERQWAAQDLAPIACLVETITAIRAI
jgi:hypothetical protein